MAPPRKHSSKRGRKDRKFSVVNLSDFADKRRDSVPELPDADTMQPSTIEAWEAFWSSELAAAVVIDETDMPALVRLFVMRDDHARFVEEYRTQPIVEGSKGQPVATPVFAMAQSLAKEIRALEDRFGGTPLARLRISVEMGEAAKSLDQLNAIDLARWEAAPDVVDPRLAALEADESEVSE